MKNSDMPINGTIEKCGDILVKDGGLTKREHFAVLAMQGSLGSAWNDRLMAERAVSIADALLAALEADDE